MSLHFRKYPRVKNPVRREHHGYGFTLWGWRDRWDGMPPKITLDIYLGYTVLVIFWKRKSK